TNGFTVTFEAVSDATGSINTTSQGEGFFYQYVKALYGQDVAPDQGLSGFSMPGSANQPQPMTFDPAQNWFSAEGIPLTPNDDEGNKNYFPLMRLVARDSSGVTVACAEVALPVSDEMDCRACHASGSQAAARPPSGWSWYCDPSKNYRVNRIKDYKLNILRYHDEIRAGTSNYTTALKLAGYNTAGLIATVNSGQPVLCIRCHSSDALPQSGIAGMRPLTRLIHTKHAKVIAPNSALTMDDVNQSAACLSCH